MTEKFIRTYSKHNIDQVKSHLMITGDLSANCANCNEVNLKLDMQTCPGCSTEIKYVAFRNIKNNIQKLQKLLAQRPSLTIVDYEDYKRCVDENKAKDLFK